jgi:hypothetical protein
LVEPVRNPTPQDIAKARVEVEAQNLAVDAAHPPTKYRIGFVQALSARAGPSPLAG